MTELFEIFQYPRSETKHSPPRLFNSLYVRVNVTQCVSKRVPRCTISKKLIFLEIVQTKNFQGISETFRDFKVTILRTIYIL